MEKKLERDESNKMLAGVAAGLSDYLSIDVTWVRVLFICLVIFGFSGIWIYIILWIAVPVKAYVPVSGTKDYRQADFKAYETAASYGNSGTFGQPPVNPVRKEKDNSVRYVTGMILIALGSYFLLDQFIVLPEWISITKLWPLVFVAIGLVILFKPSAKKKEDVPQKETPFENNENTSQAAGEEPLI
jgi:phage shock protein C